MHSRFPRKELTRIGAPLAFLAAVTIFVYLLHAGWTGGNGASSTASTSTKTRTQPPATTRHTTTQKTTTRKKPTKPPAKYYVIVSGDTFGIIASREGTTVEKLIALNPGINPSALSIGQKIRVG